MAQVKDTPIAFSVWGTPVKVNPAILANLLGLWGLLSWLAGRHRPERPWFLRVVIGFLSTVALLIADLGHAMAHIISARHAGAPMDEIQISAGMPRTVYFDNEVPPSVHRLRASGGPVYSALGLLTSLGLRALSPSGSALREVADWSCLGHGFIFLGSLVPLPFVDGGTLVKWTLVEQGRTPSEADEAVRQVDLALGLSATATGLALAAAGRRRSGRQRWLPALGLIAGGAVAILAALDKIR